VTVAGKESVDLPAGTLNSVLKHTGLKQAVRGPREADVIRILQPNDLEPLVAFFEANNTPDTTKYFDPFPLDRQTAERIVAGDGNLYYVAETTGVVRGFCMIRFWSGFEDATTGLLVGYESRGRGLGVKLIAHVVTELQRLGKNCTAFIDLGNTASIRVVEHVGFEKVGERSKDGRRQGVYRYVCVS
jgi:L-amino acid N-acyltransferase YncA